MSTLKTFYWPIVGESLNELILLCSKDFSWQHFSLIQGMLVSTFADTPFYETINDRTIELPFTGQLLKQNDNPKIKLTPKRARHLTCPIMQVMQP